MLTMSGRSGAPCNDLDESISSFAASSHDSEISIYQSKYQKECEKTQKLEDKLSGYKTVVQQIPKLQETIVALKRSHEEREKEYRANFAEHQKIISHLQSTLQNIQQRKLGLTDLDICHPRGVSPSHTHSSPSFEIIEKSTCSSGAQKDVQNLHQAEAACPTHISNTGTVLSLSNDHRNIKSLNQLQTQQVLSSLSKDLPQQSVNIENVSTGGIVGSPKHTVGLLRGYSTNLPISEHNFHHSALNQLNSYPATKGGIVSVFASGNKKPIWQMEQEAALRKSESSEFAQRSLPANASSTQGAKSWGTFNSPSHTSNNVLSATSFEAFMQAEASGTGARLKEWKPLNTLTTKYRDLTSLSTMKPSDHNVAQLENQMRTVENSGYELVGGPDLTLNLNNLSMTSKVTGNFLETPLLNEATVSEDLMKFPSLNTNSPSPVSERKKTIAASSPIYSQQNGIVFPTDEQSHLASQAESMAAIFEKNDSPTEMSDMLYKFADNAKNMEKKLNEYKTLIQRQQLQIQHLQCSSKHSQGEENTRLREEISTLKLENDALLDFIGALNEKKGEEAESGWVSVLAVQNATDPVRAHYPDSPIMKKIESLSNINAKLFRANKDWHNKWEVLRQQTQEEKADLEARVNALETVNKRLQENVTSLEKELQSQNATVQDLTKTNESSEENRLAFQRVNEALSTELSCLKSEVKDLTRSKKMLETELASLKNLSRSRDSQQIGSKELQSEIGLLKQQLTVFAEDFEKERKDRMLAESKAEKFRKERDQIRLSLDSKLKKVSAQLRAQENDLRMKARQNADLLYQVDNLKLKLQHEQRKSALTAQNAYSYQPPPASYQGPISIAYSSGLNGHMTNPGVGDTVSHLFANSNPGSSHLHQSSPEHLPGAWKCRHCTYINYPNRTVCDICGYTHSNAESLPIAESDSGRNELHSRGEERRLRDTDDVVVDHD